MSILRNRARREVRNGADVVSAGPHFEFTRLILLLFTALLAAAFVVSGCSRKRSAVDESNKLSKRVVQYGQPVPKGGGRYKVGKPYKVAGRWYTPREDPSYNKVGVASWYGDLFHGRYTANGEIFDMDALTAAHPTLPLPSYVRVTSLQNGRSLVLRLNDRGPYAHDRIIDLSRASAHALGFGRAGTARVRVQYLGPAPLNGDDSLERRIYASQPWVRRHASLKTKHKKAGVTLLAQAAQKEVAADQIVVGSIPKEAGESVSAPSWKTQSEAAANGRRVARGGRHFVQAASFNNKDFAERLGQSFDDIGPVQVLPTKVGETTWYRVRVGPFDQRHDADEALRAVYEAGMSDARIVAR